MKQGKSLEDLHSEQDKSNIKQLGLTEEELTIEEKRIER